MLMIDLRPEDIELSAQNFLDEVGKENEIVYWHLSFDGTTVVSAFEKAPSFDFYTLPHDLYYRGCRGRETPPKRNWRKK